MQKTSPSANIRMLNAMEIRRAPNNSTELLYFDHKHKVIHFHLWGDPKKVPPIAVFAKASVPKNDYAIRKDRLNGTGLLNWLKAIHGRAWCGHIQVIREKKVSEGCYRLECTWEPYDLHKLESVQQYEYFLQKN